MFDDVVNGYVSIEAAWDVYAVDIEYTGEPGALVRPPESYRVRGLGARRASA